MWNGQYTKEQGNNGKIQDTRNYTLQGAGTGWSIWRLYKGCIGGTVRRWLLIACVASVPVLFRSKQRPRNRILGSGCARMLRGQFDSRNSTETLATQAMMSGTLSPLGQMFGGKHRHRDVRTGVYHQMEQLFTNRKFHFCSHRNFRVFFLNGSALSLYKENCIVRHIT